MSASEQHRDTYREEAYELLAELETSLLELEDNPDDTELVGRIFRAMHTIKGSGSMFGFDDIALFTHEVETIFDMVRNGLLEVSKELINLTLSSRDHIKLLLDEPESVDEQKGAEIINSLKQLSKSMAVHTNPDDSLAVTGCKDDPLPSELQPNTATYRIRFRPAANIFLMGTDPVLLINELEVLGDCNFVAQTDKVPLIVDIDPESCYIYWDIILTTDQGINAIKDVFIFVEDESELLIDVLDDHTMKDTDRVRKKLGEILVERGDLNEDDLEIVLGGQKPIGEMLVEAGIIEPGKIESALAEQQHIENIRLKKDKTDQSVSSIRVSSDKLDSLVNLVGELVTVQARLTQTSAARNDPELLIIAEEVERLTDELRDNTMSVRMVPIGSMYSKFKRLIRDLSAEMGKEILMSSEGADTEMDKTVIDKLNDPMVHLIRNCIDHGIESPDDRRSLGKPEQGMLNLTARHSGAHVVIEIADDGAGLDPELIRGTAVEKGLIEQNAELTEKEIFELILTPGFSTAQKVTNVSGRGVGMDVVKRNIEALRGSIDITSKKGIGTTITLSLPLTLAIIDGLLVKVGAEIFVVPLSLVEECVELTAQDISNAHGRQIANVRGEIVPYINLREKFSINGGKPEIEQIVITRVNDQRVGFVVDHVIGEHQTVIKSLGRVYRDIEGVSGATILGDGTVALILDVTKLVQNTVKEEALISGSAK